MGLGEAVGVDGGVTCREDAGWTNPQNGQAALAEPPAMISDQERYPDQQSLRLRAAWDRLFDR